MAKFDQYPETTPQSGNIGLLSRPPHTPGNTYSYLVTGGEPTSEELIYASLDGGTTDDWDPTGWGAGVDGIVITTTGDCSLVGLLAQASDTKVRIFNAGSGTLLLFSEDSDTAANQFFLPIEAEASLTIPPGGGITAVYDGEAPGWRCVLPAPPGVTATDISFSVSYSIDNSTGPFDAQTQSVPSSGSTVLFDEGSNTSVSNPDGNGETYIFTTPYAGRYHFDFWMEWWVSGYGDSDTLGGFQGDIFSLGNVQLVFDVWPQVLNSSVIGPDQNFTRQIAVTIDLEEGDVVYAYTDNTFGAGYYQMLQKSVFSGYMLAPPIS